ncbi:MAG: non-homologous end-joining DNA ligase [Euryarchaeota archaeon]|nr:non-homologous end-joining DNA ligase [Euryarchaeota archaeon]
MLEEYTKKRDFRSTLEPQPPTEHAPSISPGVPPIFVIQKHNARRIHFDLRLELNGVLKSWAVPKGLSDDPSAKRLAIMTEDHPLAYAKFFGEIPKGEYGGGTVELWDKGKFVNITIKNGTVQPLNKALENGHFTIYLKGDKLKGTYAFTRLDDKQWIIVRKREPHHVRTEIDVNGHRITITHPHKELDTGISKAELVEYYCEIAPLMLPHVKDRLVSMLRFPEGVNGEKFFQKNIPDYFPDWLESKCIEHTGGMTCYPIIKDEVGIVYLASQVVVPHIMVTRADKPDTPDQMIFDLDPSAPDVPSLRSAARELKSFLESLGFTPYIMTTGGRGYHIAVPIIRELDSEEVRGFALKIAETLARYDETLTTEFVKEKRKNRIFVDVNRISAMQTSIAPYAARAERGIPIASPFAWDELPNISPTSYTIRNHPKEDAWRDFFAHATSLEQVLKKLT